MENIKEKAKELIKDPQVVRIAATTLGSIVGGALAFFGVRAMTSEDGLIEEVVEAAAAVAETVSK